MDKLRDRVLIELEQWPEHATLNDVRLFFYKMMKNANLNFHQIIIIIKRIKGFSSTSPLVRFNVGMQILRQKVHEWNLLAHKLNNFKEIEVEIAEIIQSWMQMELQCWRQSLDQTFEGAKGKAYRYWFFLYNLIHEFLSDDKHEEMPPPKKISATALTKVLNQFIESSTFAEFKLRLRLLKAFQLYVGKLPQNVDEKNQIISLLHNIHSYFSQFSEKVQEQIDTVRQPIESNLRKLVKIHSFNKDLSYFSVESNIKQVHRNLHKHLKEFDVAISKKVIDLFVYKDQSFELNTSNNAKKINTLNMNTFIISNELPAVSEENMPLFIQDTIKYIPKSRGLIKKSLNNVQYPLLIESLEEMIENELETCNHLRAQKVDESLPRNKQKSQAKSILNQKRKALSEFFKAMTSSLGMNYKTGLLTSSLNPELINFQITPYTIKKLKITDDDGKADLYYNKSIFKMKLLMNSLLSPRPDMDRTFLERIKGFAVDLFSLAQNQRVELSGNANELINFKHLIRDIEVVIDSKGGNFEKEARKSKIIQDFFLHAIETFDQFKVLMKCAPENNVSEDLKAITSANNVLHQKSKIYKDIMAAIDACSQELKFINQESRFVVSGEEMVAKLNCFVTKLSTLKNLFSLDNECSVYGRPILELHEKLTENLHKIEEINEEPCEEMNNIEDDLSKLSHTILLSIQNVYKQYRDEEKVEDEEKEPLQNQLKEHLHLKLSQDIKMLGLKNVNATLKSITDSIFSRCNEKSIQMLQIVYPLLKQFMLLVDFFLIQQINAHRLSTKMLSIMLSVFIELSKNGFCVPENLLSDEEQKEEMDQKPGEGFGFEDGQGEKDVSDKLESEDQLDEAKKAEDYDKENKEENQDCKEEKGIDMSENFEGKMHDVDKNDEDEDNDPNENEKEEMDKEMGETGEDAEKLDDQIWGSDDENEQEEEEGKNEEDGKGSGDKDDKHNDLDTKENEANTQEQEEQGEGLDAASEMEDKRKKSKNDIDKMNEEGNEEEVDQTNPYHNELEEPPEPEDLNLDDNVDLDNEEKDEKEANNEDNPFDIDNMKNGMDVDEEMGSDSEEPAKEKDQSEELSEADEETEKMDENLENAGDEQENEPENAADNEEAVKQPDAINPEEKEEEGDNPEDNKHSEIPNDYHESKDKQSKEENIESMPSQNDKGSHDQVQTESSEDQNQENMEIDDQDTGEDKDGTGQAENKESKSGHQGVANQKEAPSQRNRNDNEKQQKRKKGNTDQERTLGDVDRLDKKFLKTVDKLNRENDQNESENNNDKDEEADEYQHVKDAKKSDKSTLDNATQEQSKKIQHEDDAKNQENEDNDVSSFNTFLKMLIRKFKTTYMQIFKLILMKMSR